ncbi:hypothetical protein P256_01667 [Acinetobacter nectaris CIP 110549]|uniref:Uncharacterized protein n=1 Tax=Acinetobacter nectaris CIP 110549 TaxID=1392540 RepID=V2T8R0_9GAMM|nr:hypothetical protein [Acinetobacter nectaris]ESK38848.1 hypothetical protein P256_01667 [Acinetobacter nectaris CIP 110549]MCF8998371.1 hypothetical protein [Acinetobacter nectaris]MCF9027777.1 hypothetical protein [Acinetobacter nectaris]
MSDQQLEFLIAFAESGNQQKIVFPHISYQGWIMEISEEGLVISTGFNEKKGKDILLSLEELQQAELFFWDQKTSEWTAFKNKLQTC